MRRKQKHPLYILRQVFLLQLNSVQGWLFKPYLDGGGGGGGGNGILWYSASLTDSCEIHTVTDNLFAAIILSSSDRLFVGDKMGQQCTCFRRKMYESYTSN